MISSRRNPTRTPSRSRNTSGAGTRYSVSWEPPRTCSAPDAPYSGATPYLSDGKWIWRGDLWFYVRTHHVELPAEFLADVRGNKHLVPPEDAPRIIRIARYVDARISWAGAGESVSP